MRNSEGLCDNVGVRQNFGDLHCTPGLSPTRGKSFGVQSACEYTKRKSRLSQFHDEFDQHKACIDSKLFMPIKSIVEPKTYSRFFQQAPPFLTRYWRSKNSA